MPEPTTTTAAAVTLVAASTTVPVLAVFGVPLGLRVDFLVAGFGGSIVAMVLLNIVPSTGDTWKNLLRDTTRRMLVALASSMTSGYLTPNVLLLGNIPLSMVLGVAFAVGGGAQWFFFDFIQRLRGKRDDEKEKEPA